MSESHKVDPGTKFTGGVKIVFKKPEERYCSGMSDDCWGKARIAHVALSDQPLAAFVEVALNEKGFPGRSFQIAAFTPEINLMVVNANLTSGQMH